MTYSMTNARIKQSHGGIAQSVEQTAHIRSVISSSLIAAKVFMEDKNLMQEISKLRSMGASDAKEIILECITTLKLTEKDIASLEEDLKKWQNRLELSRSKGADDLVLAAVKEIERMEAKLTTLREEHGSLRNNIASMHRQLPGLKVRERSIDPYILAEELLLAIEK